MEYALTPEVGKFFVTFNIFFDLVVDNQTASSYADDIINEFFRLYNYQGLKLLWKSQGTYQSQIVVHKSFGYLPYTKEKVSAFLKYRPLEGLGVFIGSLLDKYVPGNATTELQSFEMSNRPEKSLASVNTLANHPDIPDHPNIPEKPWDGLYAVEKGIWDGYWVKYDHDNNIWRYYPWLYNITNLDVRWDMKGDWKIHTHIARKDLQEWIAGNITDEEAMRRIIGTRDLAISIIGDAAISILSCLYLSGIEGSIIGIIASIIVSLILWLLSLLGQSKSEWLTNTVEAETNDGFCWSWGFHTTSFDAYAYEPLLGWLSYINEYTAEEYSQILSRYHRINLLCYQVREFQMTWGANRDGSPDTYSTELWYYESIPAGIFAEYGSLSK